MKKFILSILLTLTLLISPVIASENMFIKVRGSVALISTETGIGTGFAIFKNENSTYFLTDAHVVDKETNKCSLKIGYSDKVHEEGKIISLDKNLDLAIIKLDNYNEENINCLDLVEKEPELGEKLYTIGNPVGLHLILVSGEMCGKDENYWNNNISYFMIYMTGYPGMSGGPIFNKDGKVVSIVQRRWVRRNEVFDHITFGCSLENIKKFLNRNAIFK